MGFFGGSEKTEEIGIDKLDEKLDFLFNDKIAWFAKKASRISPEIDIEREKFRRACDEFDKVSDEPTMDYILGGNPSYIKSQKGAYSMALLHVAERYSTAEDERNLRERYATVLASIDGLLDGMLKTNSQFKHVVMAYPRHLGEFKSVFSRLQQLAANLKRELDRTDREFEEFNDIKGHIYKIMTLVEERSDSNEELHIIEDQTKTADNETNNGTSELTAKRDIVVGKLESIEASITEKSSAIAAMFLGLGKVARLYDHASASKHKLAPIVDDPLGALGSNEAYIEFQKLVSDMKSKVESNTLAVKNKDEILTHIASIQGRDIYGELSKIGLMKNEERALFEEKTAYDNLLARIEGETIKSRDKANRHETVGKNIRNLDESIGHEKSMIEELVLRYYKRKISIVN